MQNLPKDQSLRYECVVQVLENSDDGTPASHIVTEAAKLEKYVREGNTRPEIINTPPHRIGRYVEQLLVEEDRVRSILEPYRYTGAGVDLLQAYPTYRSYTRALRVDDEIRRLMTFFGYSALPLNLQLVASAFHGMATDINRNFVSATPQKLLALQNLLIARDAAVLAADAE